MRYKATFHPTSILGNRHIPPLHPHPQPANSITDPETLTFSPLSPTLLALLSQRPYISLSRELRLRPNLPASPSPSDYLQADKAYAANFESELHLGKEQFLDDYDYVVPNDRDTDSKVAVAASEGSLFDVGMPGVMSTEEVMAIMPEIEKWKIKSGTMEVQLGVRTLPYLNGVLPD